MKINKQIEKVHQTLERFIKIFMDSILQEKLLGLKQ